MSKVSEVLKQSKKTTSKESLWKGPIKDGISFSMLSRFLVCRERFRIAYILGLRPSERFEPKRDFGTMWHACEEALAANKPWEPDLAKCAQRFAVKYMMDRDSITHWYGVAKALFPVYVHHWTKHPDVKNRTPISQEEVFNVRYELPSGRVVRLRGKFDSVDQVGTGKDKGVWLQENKTKSQIDSAKVQRQLRFDLQTMIYIVAMTQRYDEMGWAAYGPIKGVRYNVVKRSAHRQGKKETPIEFLNRIAGLAADEPNDWFARWQVVIAPSDIKKFRRTCLDPILEQLCDWWEYVKDVSDPFASSDEGESRFGDSIHWTHPFGVWNVLDEGGSTDLDEYLDSGSEVGLERREALFEELT